MKNIFSKNILMSEKSVVRWMFSLLQKLKLTKQTSEVEKKMFTSSLYICPEAYGGKGGAGGIRPPTLTTTPFPS
jgi:hypothetical protein